MELSDELLEDIGAYLAGRLPAAEKARFEARMQADADLRAEVTTQREIKQGLQFLHQKDRFKAMHADLQQRGLLNEPAASVERPVQRLPTVERTLARPLWTYVAVAASLVLVLGLGWVAYQNWSEARAATAENQRAFAAFFAPTLKSQPVQPADPDRVAAPLPKPASADSARLATAVVTLQRNELQAAITQLKPLADGPPGHWSASAQWYLALAYLRNDDRDQAQALLNQVAALNGHPYQREAQALRQQLVSETP